MKKTSSIQSFIDLFCGIGGFHHAASAFDIGCVFASDIDLHCRRQYEHDFGIQPYGDITEIEAESIPDHDILFAGFPCQPFSIAGDMKGISDSRGTLFMEILRILDVKRPQVVLLENVRQFATMRQGQVLEQVLKGLNDLGYKSDWRILNALDFGLPQKRERLIIVGMQEKLDNFQWPQKQENYKSLTDILEQNPDRCYFASEYIREKRKSAHIAQITPSIWHENKGGNISSHPYSCAIRANASYNYLLVDGERRFTPRELLRLQGFPESVEIIGSDHQLRKQAGNSVPVPMIEAVLRQIIEAQKS